MSPERSERFARVEAIFEAAVERPPDERARYLDEACAGDAGLRREVESLLAADDSAGGFLERPAVRHGMSILPADGADAPPVDRLGPYKLLRKIGEGGMSEVFLAVRADDEYQKRVAVKIIRRGIERDDVLRRFRTERQILAGLDHPNIATLYDGGSTDDGMPYFVMEYIDGVPIEEYCDERQLPIADRLRLFRTVCSAVQYAHQNLVVHRDIKSGNILVTADGTPKLLDFGIAKLIRPDQFAAHPEYTATFARPMTPRYASPEQIRGRHVGTPSDVYSLGVLLYRLLAGRLPYRLDGRSETELPSLIVDQEPERPSTSLRRDPHTEPGGGSAAEDAEAIARARRATPARLERQLRGDLDNIVMMALRKEPHRRYASVEQFSEDVRRYLEGLPLLARTDTYAYRTAKFVQRNRFAVAAAATFVALLIAFGATMAVQASRLARERDQVRLERDRAERVAALLEEIFTSGDPYESDRGDVSAAELLERGAERVNAELADQPELQSALLHTIASASHNLGMLDRAETLLRQVLDTRRRVLGTRDPAVADTETVLGVVRGKRGDLDEAARLLEDAVAIRRERLDADDPKIAEALNHLGVVRRKQGDYSAAEAAYREAIEIQSRGGSSETSVGETKNNLATLQIDMGRFDAAEALLRESLEIRRRTLGPDHPLLAQGLSNLGACLGIAGRYDDAEPYLVEALAMYRKVLPPEHPSLVEPLNNLGKLYQKTGRFDDAEPLLREALAVQRASVGERHPTMGPLHGNLADLLSARGDWKGAEEEALASVTVRRESLGPDHPDLGAALVALAQVRLGRGNAPAAERDARAGLAILERALAADHWRPANARSVLGEALAALGRDDEAERLLVAGWEGLRDARGFDHPRTRAALERLATFYESRGRSADLARVTRPAP